jgi:hypothetical protein
MKPDWLTVVRFRYARDHDNPPLASWLRRLAYLGATVRDSSFSPRVDLTRNREVGRWLEEDRTQYLLMIDSDMVPVPETAAILVEEGDLVACPYVDQAGHVIDWERQGLQTGCLRVSRALMACIPQPWFEYRLSEDLRTVEAGEAATFAAKVLAAGAKPRLVGRIGHLMPMVALPSAGPDHSQPDWRYLWQYQA